MHPAWVVAVQTRLLEEYLDRTSVRNLSQVAKSFVVFSQERIDYKKGSIREMPERLFRVKEFEFYDDRHMDDDLIYELCVLAQRMPNLEAVSIGTITEKISVEAINVLLNATRGKSIELDLNWGLYSKEELNEIRATKKRRM
jgi:hypothetical protein